MVVPLALLTLIRSELSAATDIDDLPSGESEDEDTYSVTIRRIGHGAYDYKYVCTVDNACF